MKRNYLVLTLIFAACFFAQAFSQSAPKIKKSEFLNIDAGKKEAWKAVKIGNKHYKQGGVGHYRIAAANYLMALDYNEMYAPLLFRCGVSELMSGFDKLALRHLTDAYDFSSSVAPDCQYWLGVSKQHLNMFEDARRDLDECSSMFDKKTAKILRNSVALRLTQCDLGIMLKDVPDLAVVQWVDGEVNNEMPQLAPVFSNLDSSLYFGSKVLEGNVSKKIGKDGDPNSDIFFAKAQNGKFVDLKNPQKKLNKSCSDYPVNMNLNGLRMFVLKKDKKVFQFYRKSENSKFLSAGKIMKKVVSLSFSKDSSMILFCTDKGNGQGGFDIWYAKKMRSKGGKYGKPQNLGEVVNSQYNEVWATFGSNDTVIYFASDGQLSVGGFDILKTSYKNGKWNKPVNLGLGINSGTDENFFQLSPGESRIGYYCSKQQGGKGDYDIYKVLLLNEAIVQLPPIVPFILAADLAKEPIMKLEEPEIIRTMRLTVVKGKVTDYDGLKNLYAQITITDNATNKVMQQIMTDSETGDYTVMLESGKNYAMTVSSDGYLFHSENFDIPQTTSYQEIKKDIKLLPMDPGSKVVLNNVFFDTGKSDLREESFGELQRLAEVFRLYPNLVIEVSGHTDNQGNRQYNIQLSQKRAEAVREHLLLLGVKENQVVAKGYGPDQPRDSNATAEGRQNNRRVEAKILSN